MGPKKKTKEELEAERLLEEAEAAKQAAIAAKKAAELEEKRRLEELRLAEERRVLRAAEVARLDEEYNKYLDRLKDKQAQRLAEQALLVSQCVRAPTSGARWLTFRLNLQPPIPQLSIPAEIPPRMGKISRPIGPARCV